ncbi:BMP-2-inducible protein kinase [Tritrichomonas musculus]|uniref:non-specific serine/threonine protein kinase n=1 Tax=Tritrichomonas musculus TaxID=1915356 RepID=A0ABR2IQY4_9EUKA
MKKSSNSIATSLIGSVYSIEGIKVTIQEKIDESQYGTVFSCTDMANAKHVLKVLQAQDTESEQRILNEYNIQKSLSVFPNVVKIEGFLEMDKSYKILTEYCETSLFNEYSRFLATGFSTDTIVNIFYSVLSVIKAMHEQIVPILYRDIKIENIVCKQGAWKIANFASSSNQQYLTFPDVVSRQRAQRDFQRNIVPSNRSPEMVDLNSGFPVNEKTDIWALGCFLFKLCNFKDAFPGGNVAAIKSGSYQWRANWNKDEFLKSIVAKCLQVDPRNRPTIQQLAQEFRTHYGIKETSFATKFGKSPKIKYNDYIEEVINFQPPPSFTMSDESDVEMDDESKLIQDNTFEKVTIDSNAFEQLFDFTDESSNEIQPNPEVLDLSEASNLNIEFHAPKTPAADIEEEESSSEEVDENDFNGMLLKCPTRLMSKIYESDEEEVHSIFQIIADNPDFAEFIIFLVRESGTRGAEIIRLLPEELTYSPSSTFNDYLHLRREFSIKFPMFEGNFSLHDFTQEYKSSPPPPGQPPVSVEVIQSLLDLLEKYITVLNNDPCQGALDDGDDLYRVACYITAKLRQFDIEPEFVNSTVISSLDNDHDQVVDALKKYQLSGTFPKDSFDFNNLRAVYKLRAPKHKNIFE